MLEDLRTSLEEKWYAFLDWFNEKKEHKLIAIGALIGVLLLLFVGAFLSLAKTSTLTVVVTSEEGVLDQAQVILLDEDAVVGERFTVRGKTGFPNVPAKKLSVKVSKEGFEDKTIVLDASAQEMVRVTLKKLVVSTLEPTPVPTPAPVATPTAAVEMALIEVLVLDAETAKPIQGASVTLSNAATQKTLASGTTNAEGSYSAEAPRGSSIEITAEAEGYSASSSSIQSSSRRLTLSLSKARETSSARVIVVDAQNNSISGASVKIVGGGKTLQEGTTDAQGEFRAGSLDASKTYLTSVSKKGFKEAIKLVTLPQTLVVLEPLLPFCGIQANATEFTVNQTVNVTIRFEEIQPKQLSCGGENTTLSCSNSSCSGSCAFASAGSKVVSTDLPSCSVLNLTVTQKGVAATTCRLQVEPTILNQGESARVKIAYENATEKGTLDCGVGDKTTLDCPLGEGVCQAICQYPFLETREASTKTIKAAFGQNECGATIQLLPTNATLEVTVFSLSLPSERASVAVFKNINGSFLPAGFGYTNAQGKIAFSGFTLGESVRVNASGPSELDAGTADAAINRAITPLNLFLEPLPPMLTNETILPTKLSSTLCVGESASPKNFTYTLVDVSQNQAAFNVTKGNAIICSSYSLPCSFAAGDTTEANVNLERLTGVSTRVENIDVASRCVNATFQWQTGVAVTATPTPISPTPTPKIVVQVCSSCAGALPALCRSPLLGAPCRVDLPCPGSAVINTTSKSCTTSAQGSTATCKETVLSQCTISKVQPSSSSCPAGYTYVSSQTCQTGGGYGLTVPAEQAVCEKTSTTSCSLNAVCQSGQTLVSRTACSVPQTSAQQCCWREWAPTGTETICPDNSICPQGTACQQLSQNSYACVPSEATPTPTPIVTPTPFRIAQAFATYIASSPKLVKTYSFYDDGNVTLLSYDPMLMTLVPQSASKISTLSSQQVSELKTFIQQKGFFQIQKEEYKPIVPYVPVTTQGSQMVITAAIDATTKTVRVTYAFPGTDSVPQAFTDVKNKLDALIAAIPTATPFNLR